MGLRHEADVVVAGGGMAGIAAAIAAARTGAKTILIERAGWLGGIGITGATGLHSFYNIYNAEKDAPRLKLVDGIAQELIDAVREMKGGIGHVELERGGDFVSMLTPVDPEAFKIAAALLCREAGVKLLLHTTVEDVDASDGEARSLKVWSKDGFGTVSGRMFVDCTGTRTTKPATPAPTRSASRSACATWTSPRSRPTWRGAG
jgi:flavin-dependent dehydrogenase